MVNIQIDVDVEEDKNYLYTLLDEIEQRNGYVTVYFSGEFAHNRPDIVKEVFDRQHQVGVKNWNNQEDLTRLSYEEQLESINRSFMAVRTAIQKFRPAFVADFRPQNFQQNNDTFKVLQELEVRSNSGFIGYKSTKTHPYHTEYNFIAIPIATVFYENNEIPLIGRFINKTIFKELLIKKYNENNKTKEPMAIVVDASLGKDIEKLNAFIEFLDYVKENSGKIVMTDFMTTLANPYIASIKISNVPEEANVGDSISMKVTTVGTCYCPSYHYKAYGRYSKESLWKELGSHSKIDITGSYQFLIPFTIPEPLVDDDEYIVRVVGRACHGVCWPTADYYEKIDEVIIEIKTIKKKEFIWPVSGKITSGYYWRDHPIKKKKESHTGIDIGAPTGTPIRAAADGRIIIAGWQSGLGYRILIEHKNKIFTLYGHLSKIKVEKGKIEQGDIIGYVGSTGLSTGPHLHFGIYKGAYNYYNTHVDPMKYLPCDDPPVNQLGYSLTGELNNNYSDYGIDTDGDELYNYLVVGVELNITSAGVYDLKGFLYDNSGSQFIGWAENYTYLDLGIQTVQLFFNGMEIRAHRINGPYNLTVGLYDEIGNQMDYQTNAYITSGYNYTDFQAPLAEFTGYYLDYGTDTNNDSLFDYLTIEIEINATAEGNYSIEGILYDINDEVVTWASNYTHMNGIQTIKLNFGGGFINTDGGYVLKDLTLYRANEHGEDEILLDYKKDAFTTSLYSSTDFQPSLVKFTGDYSDYGTDIDSDGLFDYLTVEIGVNVTSAGNYTIEGMLYDANDGVVAWGGNYSYLNVGVQTLQLNFDGMLIYDYGVNGPYNLSYLSISDENGIIVNYQSDAYTTSAYNFTDFQQGGEITGFVSDVNGTPIHEAYIAVSGPELAFAFTDINGGYTLPWLQSGIYDVSVSSPSGFNLLDDSANVTVIDGETTFVNFTLQLGGIITGTVTDYNGDSVHNASVQIIGDSYYSTYTNESGDYIFSRLKEGDYNINVTLTSNLNLLENSTAVYVQKGEIKNINFTLNEGGIINGLVKDYTGTPVPDLNITVTGPIKYNLLTGQITKVANTNENGSFTVSGLKTGDYNIYIDFPADVNLVSIFEESLVYAGETTNLNFTVHEGGILKGYIRRAGVGLKIVNARIEAAKYPHVQYRFTYSDEHGFYEIKGLDGEYDISVIPPTGENLRYYTTPYMVGIEVSPGSTVWQDFELTVGGRIYGYIKDSYSNPVYNAYIDLRHFLEGVSGYGFLSAYSGVNGSYEFRDLESANYRMYIEPPPESIFFGSYIESIYVVEPNEYYINITLQKECVLIGYVFDYNGNPVENAYVHVDGPSYSSDYTDENGIYNLTRLRNGTYNVIVDPPFSANLLSETLTVYVIEGETTYLNITLQEGGILTGYVFDYNGGSVEDVYVGIEGYTNDRTDENGIYNLTGLNGTYNITVWPPSSRIDLLSETLTVNVSGSEIVYLNITLQKGGIITGYVFDYNGYPVGGAYVRIEGYTNDYTDENGIYNLTRLINGTYNVTARPPSGANLLLKTLTVNVTQGEVTYLNITLQKGGVLTGHVFDYNGGPVEDAYVYISGPSYGSDYTDENGIYNLTKLRNGTYSVTVDPPSGADLFSKTVTVYVIEGEITYLNITLHKEGILTGYVFDSDGNPVMNVQVKVSPTYYDDYTDENGIYNITELKNGTYNVTAKPLYGANLFSKTVTVNVTKDEITYLNITLQKGGILTGYVFDYNGSPVEDVYINVDGPSYGSDYTAENGWYNLTKLRNGIYNVTADSPSNVNLLSKTVTVNVTEGEITYLNITLQKGGIITGHVFDSDWDHVQYARMYLGGPSFGEDWTDTNGVYSFIGLVSGTYTVNISYMNYGPWYIFVEGVYVDYENSTTIDLTSGQTIVVDFTQQPPSFISLYQGWNLISLPLKPGDAAIETVLGGLTGQIILWYYNVSSDMWYVYDSNALSSLNTLQSMDYGKAYWLKSTINQTLTVYGDTVTDYIIGLKPDWNFVGYNMSTSVMPDPISGLTTPIMVWTYYTDEDEWNVYDTSGTLPNTLDNMTQGKGYWLKSDVEQDWKI